MIRRMMRARWRLAGAVLLGVIGLAFAGFLVVRGWAPDRKAYPLQGPWLDLRAGPVEWRVLRATGPGAHGADFVYLTASEGAGYHDIGFVDAVDAARAAHLQVGAVHVYDLCASADAQGANFVTSVPRDAALLPTGIAIDIDPHRCANPPAEATVKSELATFLNQIERHLGKPAILMPSRAVEERYHLAGSIERNVWLAQDFVVPTYVVRPWVLWTATDILRTAGTAGPVHWVVVHP